MEVAGETLQRSRHISPAAGSYLQPYQGGMQVFFSKNQYTTDTHYQGSYTHHASIVASH